MSPEVFLKPLFEDALTAQVNEIKLSELLNLELNNNVRVFLMCKHVFKVKEPSIAANTKEKLINRQGRSRHHYKGQSTCFC